MNRTHATSFFLVLLLPALATTILLATTSGHASVFMGLGDLPGGPFVSRVRDISSNGTVIVGESAVGTWERTPGDEWLLTESFRWTKDGGMQSLGALPDPVLPSSVASGVSSDGSVIVGVSEQASYNLGKVSRNAAFRWTEQTGMTAIPLLDSPPCSEYGIGDLDMPDVSDDGTTVVTASLVSPGCITQSLRFTTDDGATALGFPDNGFATAVSADGSIVGGSVSTAFEPVMGTAWLWHEDTKAFTDLGVDGFRFVDVTDMTADGSHVTGFGVNPGRVPFVWNKETGTHVLDFRGSPYAITDDGSLIVGAGSVIDNMPAGPPYTRSAFMWTQATGRRELGDVLIDEFGLGEQIAGWELAYDTLIVTVSGDGRTVAGTGRNPDGNTEGWVAFLDRPLHRSLRPGDADQDLDFDQLDLVRVQIAGKYLTGEEATWGEGDWNAAPKIVGDGVFNQDDIVAALQANIYLTGPYAATGSQDGNQDMAGDGKVSLRYHASTGELDIDVPAGVELTSINVDSAAGIFTGEPAEGLGGSFDNDADDNIFKAMFGDSFGSLSFGDVAQPGLSREFVLGDLSVVGSLASGGELGEVDLIYVPEPSPAISLFSALVMFLLYSKRKSER